ncbi:tuftelin isoform X3 [Sarcophilus harrisii]|uniref:tuftelin isoform X3 n=1 Tax=Sarcophilus harrisii TaxID=9305 RepID=UPI00062B92C8|nr:tuftelin isoform X3 [Sarcophilus harrisii]
MNGTRHWCAAVSLHPEGESAPVPKSYTMVSGRSVSHSLSSELVESNDGHEEIIKVYLKGKTGDKVIHEKNIDQLKSEVQYIQEVLLDEPDGFRQSFTSLYKSPSDMLVRGHHNEDPESLKETVRELLAKLQEAERQHQSDRTHFETTLSRYQREAEMSSSALQRAESKLEQRDAEVLELQRCMLGMEKEQESLQEKVREGNTALEELRTRSADCLAEQEKAAQLEKEVAGLREKIHHLDDMLKSQQRKVRQMIEQLQNSKTVIQSKDTTIQELKEKVAYLEAENLEMHDRMEHLIEKQISPGNFSTQTRTKSDTLGSGRISRPPNPKPLPLIRVVET